MKLSTLLDALRATTLPGEPPQTDPEVTAVCYDSRRVVPGALFVAIEGFSVDGHRFIPDALTRGAVAVVCARPLNADAVVVQVQCITNSKG